MENKDKFIIRIQPDTGFKILELKSPSRGDPPSRKRIEWAKRRIEKLKNPCECGGDTIFEPFSERKGTSTLTGEVKEIFFGRFKCIECDKRYYVTKEQFEEEPYD